MPKSRPHLIAAILLNLAFLITLCILAPRMYPLNNGTPRGFWIAATGVDLEAAPGSRPMNLDNVIFDQDRFVWGSQYPFAVYPDNPYATISPNDAAIDFPRVQQELARRAALNDSDDFAAVGYTRWMAFGPNKGGITELFRCIEVEGMRLMYRRTLDGTPPFIPPDTYVDTFQHGLVHVSRAARLYWANFLFELLFFSALIWFAFRPYIRRATLPRKLLTITTLPFLLYLPYWFGYCNSAGPAFPIGGILYPGVGYLRITLGFLAPDLFHWELQLLSHMPPVLGAITQGRLVTFADYSTLRFSYPYQPGLVFASILSLTLTAALAAFHLTKYAVHRFRTRQKPQGFPILDPKPHA